MNVIAFRHQDDCAWDVHLQICVSDIPCELRGSTVCERELTNGASWDATQNKCFWDGRLKQCRWSEECFAREKDACLQAGCSWRRVCTPQDVCFCSQHLTPRMCRNPHHAFCEASQNTWTYATNGRFLFDQSKPCDLCSIKKLPPAFRPRKHPAFRPPATRPGHVRSTRSKRLLRCLLNPWH